MDLSEKRVPPKNPGVAHQFPNIATMGYASFLDQADTGTARPTLWHFGS